MRWGETERLPVDGEDAELFGWIDGTRGDLSKGASGSSSNQKCRSGAFHVWNVWASAGKIEGIGENERIEMEESKTQQQEMEMEMRMMT